MTLWSIIQFCIASALTTKPLLLSNDPFPVKTLLGMHRTSKHFESVPPVVVQWLATLTIDEWVFCSKSSIPSHSFFWASALDNCNRSWGCCRMLRGAEGGHGGLLRVTEGCGGCGRLWGAVREPPWSLKSQILQILVFQFNSF
jgi:hypothetical protein